MKKIVLLLEASGEMLASDKQRRKLVLICLPHQTKSFWTKRTNQILLRGIRTLRIIREKFHLLLYFSK
jgi:hypothetical protein